MKRECRHLVRPQPAHQEQYLWSPAAKQRTSDPPIIGPLLCFAELCICGLLLWCYCQHCRLLYFTDYTLISIFILHLCGTQSFLNINPPRCCRCFAEKVITVFRYQTEMRSCCGFPKKKIYIKKNMHLIIACWFVVTCWHLKSEFMGMFINRFPVLFIELQPFLIIPTQLTKQMFHLVYHTPREHR